MSDVRARFNELHRPGSPLVLPNPWDIGSAKLFASLGFQALATTSSGFAATVGRLDGSVTRDEAIAHAATIVGATDLPVSADLENGFAHDPDGVAQTIRLAFDAGLAGCSVEDYSGRDDDPIYDAGLAKERVAAAAEASGDLVLTARSENYLHGRPDLADTIARLQSFQEAGAEVLYAPGLSDIGEIRSLIESVDRPVNVLLRPPLTLADLADAGASRVSLGGTLAFVALGAATSAARELLDDGTFPAWEQAVTGAKAARAAFRPG